MDSVISVNHMTDLMTDWITSKCKHCGSENDDCLWWEQNDGDMAPCGAQQLDDDEDA